CKYNPICDTIVWRYDFGGLEGRFEAQAFTMMPDESIYLVLENSWVNGGDIYLVKIDSTGKMINECLFQTPSFTNNKAPFPNPFTTEFNIQFTENVSEVNLTMYNALGQLTTTTTLYPKPTAEGSYYVTYSAPTLAKGLYFYQLTANNKIISKGKIMKQ
ncbi:MAG: Secretion system C-terminal sorting domain, partial [Bacteroidota bacterium]